MEISVISWNMHGDALNKRPVIEEFLRNHDVLCLQEHFLIECNKELLEFPDSHVLYFSPAKRLLSHGRPSGGIATLVRKAIPSVLVETSANHIAIQIANLTVINTYLPTDYKSEKSEKCFALAAKRLAKCVTRNAMPEKLLIGDFNCDLRDLTSTRSNLILQLTSDLEVLMKNLDATYLHHTGATTNIDHVLASGNLSQSQVKVLSSTYTSDHFPITVKVKISAAAPTAKIPVWFVKEEWEKTDASSFQSVCDTILRKIKIPFILLQKSADISRDDARVLMDIYCALICHAIKCGIKAAVPTVKIRRGTRIQGWSRNSELKSACQKSKFWFQVWLDCDRPRTGWVNCVRKHANRVFARALNKHRCDCITNFSESVNQNPSALWKHALRPKRYATPDSVPREDLWEDHYRREFAPPPSNLSAEHAEKLNYSLQCHANSDFVVTRSMVISAIMKLKKKFSKGTDGICGAALDFSSDLLIDHLSLLYQMIFSSGIVPKSFCEGKLIPVLKRGKPPHLCSSYRPITVSNVFVSYLSC